MLVFNFLFSPFFFSLQTKLAEMVVKAGLCPRIDAARAGRGAGVLALVQVLICSVMCGLICVASYV